MNPIKHIFVLIKFLQAGLQVEAALGAGGEVAGQIKSIFQYKFPLNSTNSGTWDNIFINVAN